MTCMPVSNISVVGVRFSTVGASRWIGQRSLTSMSAPRSIGSPRRVEERPRARAPPAGVGDLRAARQAVGRVHGDGAHAVVAEVLLHLADQHVARPGADA